MTCVCRSALAWLLLATLLLSSARAAPGERVVDEQVWAAVSALRGIDEVPARAPRVLVFFDANCPHCADLWIRMHPESGPIAGVRWIPVAYVNGTSARRAALMFVVPDTVGELEWNFRFYDRPTRNGASREARAMPGDFEAALQANDASWRRLGALTPLILFKEGNGIPKLHEGVPDPATVERILAAAAVPAPPAD